MKPDSIFLPETDIGEQELANIIDVPSIQTMVDEFHKLTGMGVWILDLKGTVLVGVGWQDICTKYHRIHPQTARNCVESDLYLNRNLRSGEYIAYKCKNGMTDVVTPLYIGGKHIGNIYTGQFFYKDEDVDVAYFAAQATQYGFERESYLEALRRVPRFDRDSVRTLMDFLVQFTTLVSKMGYSNLNLTKAIYDQKRVEEELRKHREHLEELVKERTAELESEIIERKRAEEGLKESEQRFRALFENTPDGIVLANPENKKFTTGNPTFCQMLGYNADEIQNLGVMHIHPAEEVEHSADQFEKLLRKKIAVAENIPVKRKDGSIFFADIRAFLVSVAEKTYLAGIFRDITERKRAEEALQRQAQIIDQVHDAIISTDLEGVITGWNAGAKRMFGYSAEEALGKPVSFVYPEDQRPFLSEGIVAPLLQKGWHETEARVRSKSGKEFPIHLSVVLTKDSKGVVTGMVGSSIDITERKRAEEELFVKNKIANIFLTATTDEEIYSEVLNVVLEVMESKYGVVGYIDEDGAFVVLSMSRHIWDKCQVPEKTFIFPRDKWGDSSWPRAIREKKTNYTNELSILTPEGHINITKHISMPIIFQGEVIGLIQVANKETDYTEKDVQLLESLGNTIIAPILNVKLQKNKEELSRKRAEEEVRKLNAELEQRVHDRTAQLEASNKELEAFSYSVSHDLRAPLRAIDGFSRVILEDYFDKLDDEGKRVLSTIRKNTNKMAQLIDDLLVFSRLGRQEVRISDVDMGKLAINVFKELQVTAPERKIHFDIKELPSAQGDQAMIRQVFANLLSNAIKFTRTKEDAIIEVRGSNEGDQNMYYVKDNGVGFDMRYLNY